ncbi:MAG: DUF853 family protein [Parabacteroides sp.]|jgi:DNA helicase HerA-like ATPase|nr:DUF853 family protein [Parabacteroides sp.]MBP9482068.1 DUF853 family protein [Parabacteroides sp.]MBP9580094.1 DUF853 family protein [Parabacteroides sp.]
MLTDNKELYVAHGSMPLYIHPKMANRHGLIAGATGTGKTVSLQILAESFSELGVPVFMADMKGDLSGISKAGSLNSFIAKRQEEFGVTFQFQEYPTRFFDIFAEKGHPLRTTISDMGPLLLSRLLMLNDTQSGVLNIVFRIADDNKMLLLDLKDLRAMLSYVGENARSFTTQYGNISAASIGAIQRGLLNLEDQGGDLFFGEPDFNIYDFLQTEQGKGVINILAADKLLNSPKLYATFLLWMLSSLYEELPEVGDLERPKFIFFFDEAHLLFDDAPEVLLDKIEQIVRLIRSKGVGVYFITQNPLDLPENILGQLGNRIQHALRAFTPRDQKAVKTAAQTFRQNPTFDTETAILELATGEALVSFLDSKGAPSIVERAKMLCPQGQIGPITDAERAQAIKQSPLYGIYEKTTDRHSAYEILQEEALHKQQEEEKEILNKQREQEEKERQKQEKQWHAEEGRRISDERRNSSRQSPTERMFGNMLSSVGRTLGTQIVRSVLGTIIKRK